MSDTDRPAGDNPAPVASAPPANPFAVAALAAARAYTAEALAPATLRAYAADWRHFCGWCAEAGCAPLPAPPTAVAAYFASLAGLYSRAALDRRLADWLERRPQLGR